MPLITAYILNLIDLFCTNYWVRKYGIDAEANPVGRWMYENGSVYIFKIGVVGAALVAIYFGIKNNPSWSWVSWLVLGIYVIILIIHAVLYCKIMKN